MSESVPPSPANSSHFLSLVPIQSLGIVRPNSSKASSSALTRMTVPFVALLGKNAEKQAMNAVEKSKSRS